MLEFQYLETHGMKIQNYVFSCITSFAFKATHTNIDSTCVRRVKRWQLGELSVPLDLARDVDKGPITRYTGMFISQIVSKHVTIWVAITSTR